MRSIVCILMLLLPADSQCRLVINLDIASRTAPPEPTRVSYSPPPQPALDAPHLPDVMRLQLTEASDPNGRKRGLLDLRLYNVGANDITIPISPDGKRIYESCGKNSLLESVITSDGLRGEVQQVKAELYGCESVKGSTLTLMSGEWITIAGLSFSEQVRKGSAEQFCAYSLDEVQYSQVKEKLSVVSKGLYRIQATCTEKK